MQLLDYFLLIVVYCVGLLIAGYVYSEIWAHRLNRGKFLTGFDDLLAKSKIKKELDHIKAKIDDPDFEKKIGKAVWESTRAEKGGTMKGIYADAKAELKDMAEVEAFQYPNLLKFASELDGLIASGFVKQDFGEKFLKLAQNPTWQPRLERVATGIYQAIENDGENKGRRSGAGKWL